VDRVRVWLAVSPLIAAGVVAAHAAAYRITGTPTSPFHHYLEHVPQVLSVLAVAGLALGGLASRLRVPSAWPFPVAAFVTFVVQEHVERLVHTGDVPWLLGSRFFLVGLVLQVPVALVAWALARRLLVMCMGDGAPRPRRLPRIELVLVAPLPRRLRPAAAIVTRGRGPPALQAS
jgi:hypothetical protein